MHTHTYRVTVLLDVNDVQDVDDRAESRSYIVADLGSGQAVIIDAVIENVERDVRLVKELGLTLVYAVETHIHADHITGASLLKDRTGAQIVYGAGAASLVTGADLFLQDRQTLRFGKSELRALATPGHTDAAPVTSYQVRFYRRHPLYSWQREDRLAGRFGGKIVQVRSAYTLRAAG